MYIFVNDYAELAKLIHAIQKSESKYLSFDIESNDLDFIGGRILLLQMKFGELTYIIDVSKFKAEFLSQIIFYISRKFIVLGHNIKFDMKFLIDKYGVTLERVHDTMTTESIINMGTGSSFYSLEDLVKKYKGIQLEKSVRDQFINHSGTFTEQQLIYSALDVKYLEDIYHVQLNQIANQKLEYTYQQECALVPAVAEAEHTGMNFDQVEWLRLEQIAQEKYQPLVKIFKDAAVAKIVKKRGYTSLLEVAGAIGITIKTKRDTLALGQVTDIKQGSQWLDEHILVSSNKQMKCIFNNIFGIDCENTNAKTLERYKRHEIVQLLLDIREQEKKISTYGKKFIDDNVNKISQRVHTELLALGTSTGRFSSANPNLQNIPTEKAYRHCFIATRGWKLICADYSQQEMRITGALAKEPKLIAAFINNIDVHTFTASVIFNKLPEEVTKEERRIGKTMNFAVLYGSTKYGIAYNLKMKVEQAEEIINKFYEEFSSLSSFKQAMEDEIVKNKYSETMAGRKRYFEDKSLFVDYREMKIYYASMRREGFNQIIQGTGADVTKDAIILIRRNNPFGKSLRILLTVHDEIICEAKEEIAQDAAIFVTDMMLQAEKAFLGEIPAAVEYAIDTIWEKDNENKKERILV